MPHQVRLSTTSGMKRPPPRNQPEEPAHGTSPRGALENCLISPDWRRGELNRPVAIAIHSRESKTGVHVHFLSDQHLSVAHRSSGARFCDARAVYDRIVRVPYRVFIL